MHALQCDVHNSRHGAIICRSATLAAVGLRHVDRNYLDLCVSTLATCARKCALFLQDVSIAGYVDALAWLWQKRPSVCLSVCPLHTDILSKRRKLGSRNFPVASAKDYATRIRKAFPEIQRDHLNRGR